MRSFLLGVCCLSATLANGQLNSFIKDSLDYYVQLGMRQWQIPGLSIVVVKDGKVVVQKGYGVADITTRKPVDENTLFMIASNTKLFTGMALANLEYGKKLSIDDRIVKYFPWFRLYNDTTSQLVSIRDMLSHRIGTKTFQGDFTFWNTNLTRREVMERMRLLKPSTVFRQDYGYCNSCFLTAGQVVEAVSGQTWESYITDKLIAPLGMTNTYATGTGIEKRSNVATPYTTSFTNQLMKVPYDNWDNLAPAASIVSNVKDLANWLQFQLDSGRYKGQQIMPWSVLQRTRDINIMTGSRKSSLYPIHFRGYGLGVFAADYNGRQLYWHTGGAGGMVSNVCFVPEERLGIAILTNNDNQNFFEALRYQLLDSYLKVPFVHRGQQQWKGFEEEMKQQVKEAAGWKAKLGKQTPAQPLTDFAGTYTNALYGNISITAKGKQLLIRFNTHPTLAATLDYMGDDKWLLQYNNIEYGIFTTRFGMDGGKVKDISIKANDFVEYDPYTFTKNQ